MRPISNNPSTANRRWIERTLLTVTILLAAIGFARKLPSLFALPDSVDFRSYYEAAQQLNAGSGPYGYGYIYPPFLAARLRPLALLSFTAAARVWYAINLLVLSAIFVLAMRLTKLRGRRVPLLAIAIVLLPSTYDTLLLGQINLLVAALVLVAMLVEVELSQQRWATIVGGAALGVAAGIKLIPLVLAAYFAAARRWLALTSMLATLALTIAFGVVWGGGVEASAHYLRELLPHLLTDVEPRPENQSVAAVFTRLFSITRHSFELSFADGAAEVEMRPLVDAPAFGLWGGRLATAAAVLMTATVLLRRSRSSLRPLTAEAGFSLLVGLTMMGASIVWNYYYVLLIVPAIGLWRGGRFGVPNDRLLLIVAALCIVLQRYWIPLTYYLQSPLVTAFGLVGVTIVWLLTIRSEVEARGT